MSTKREQARKDIKSARDFIKQYVILLVGTYVGFIVLTSSFGGGIERTDALMYIEVLIAAAIFFALGYVIFHLVRARRLLKDVSE